MKERLQKIISARGMASRRRAEEWIQEGRVAVNGIVASLGMLADPDCDQITVDGAVIPPVQQYVYLMLNKPRGYVTTLSDEKGRPNAADLVSDCGMRVYPVGRLDMDSEGLLLFTNDGNFANNLMHPSKDVEKTYEVKVRGFSPERFAQLHNPVELDGYRIKPPKLELLKADQTNALFLITIHEGRNRQIRRMCEIAGMKVTKLKRVREGSLSLGNLSVGKWRYLTESELGKL